MNPWTNLPPLERAQAERDSGLLTVPEANRPALILINGLAEQEATWNQNVSAWSHRFRVLQPDLLSYDADWLHDRLAQDSAIDVPCLVDRLRDFLDGHGLFGPQCLVANSLGGKVAVEFALRYPERVARLALLGPSGMSQYEHLPVVEGVRRGHFKSVVLSVFWDPTLAADSLVAHYQARLKDRRWKLGLVRTIRGTLSHNVRHRIRNLSAPTLVIVGADDRIIDPQESVATAREIPNVAIHIFSDCGHAPQIERSDEVNRLVADFMLSAA